MIAAVAAVGGWGALAGWIAAVVGPLTVYLIQRRKTDIDESALVLGEWKKLIEAHQAQIKSLVDEIAGLRSRLTDAEARITALEAENRSLRTENEGLMRQVAQKSKSEVIALGGSLKGNAPTTRAKFGIADQDDDLIRKIDWSGE